MKKVLFATTALIATAGMASAQGVALSGSAEMGIIGGSPVAGSMQTQFHTDIDVTFTMSGETDNGLTFGATIDLDESDGSGSFAGASTVGASAAFGNTGQGGETIFLSGNFGTITMGDTDGAFDWALTEIGAGNAGSIADDETAHTGYSGNAGLDGDHDGQILRYDYSVGSFGIALSAEIDDTGVADAVLGVGFRYSFDFGGGSVDLGVGFQQGEATGGALSTDVMGLSVSVGLDSGLTATVNWWEGDTDEGGVDETYMGVGLGYSFDAFTVYANYGHFEEGVLRDEGFGLAAAYDLGGGASVHFGYGQSDNGGVYGGPIGQSSSFSLGVAMSF